MKHPRLPVDRGLGLAELCFCLVKALILGSTRVRVALFIHYRIFGIRFFGPGILTADGTFFIRRAP